MIDFRLLPKQNDTGLNCGGFAAKVMLDFFGLRVSSFPLPFLQEYCKMSEMCDFMKLHGLNTSWDEERHKTKFSFNELVENNIFMACTYNGAPYWEDSKHVEIVTGMDEHNEMSFLTIPYRFKPQECKVINFVFVSAPETDIYRFIKRTRI